MNSILYHLPYEIPRQCQIDTLLMIEEHYDAYDCFVVRAPVGAGKSGIAAAIQSWQGGGAIITNNNLLRDQYLEEFDWMKTVKAQEDYWIEKYKMTEKEFRKSIYKMDLKEVNMRRIAVVLSVLVLPLSLIIIATLLINFSVGYWCVTKLTNYWVRSRIWQPKKYGDIFMDTLKMLLP